MLKLNVSFLKIFFCFALPLHIMITGKREMFLYIRKLILLTQRNADLVSASNIEIQKQVQDDDYELDQNGI